MILFMILLILLTTVELHTLEKNGAILIAQSHRNFFHHSFWLHSLIWFFNPICGTLQEYFPKKTGAVAGPKFQTSPNKNQRFIGEGCLVSIKMLVVKQNRGSAEGRLFCIKACLTASLNSWILDHVRVGRLFTLHSQAAKKYLMAF